MRPGRARTSGPGVAPLLPAELVSWVAPVRPTHGVRFVVSRPSAALGAHVSAVSTAPWRLFTGVRAQRVLVCSVRGHFALVHRCVRLVGSVCGVLGFLARVHRCARAVCCLQGDLGHLGSCSPVCPLAMVCCVCGDLGHVAPVHRCACLVCCVVCALSLAIWLLFPGVPSRCTLCAVSLATWLLFTAAPAGCVVLCVRCPWPLGSCSALCTLGVLWVRFLWPLGSCSPVRPLAVLCCVCDVPGHLAPVHRCAASPCFVCGALGNWAPLCRCARSVCCAVSAVSLATWILFTGVPARCAVCAVSLATGLLFTGVPAPFAVLCARCPRPLGSCSLLCLLGVFCCVCGVLGRLPPFHLCARSVCCVVCAVSVATWLPFTGVHARCVVLCVQRPWPLGSCSLVCPLVVLCCVCGVLGHLAAVHRYACAVCCGAVSLATRLPFTGVPVRCAVCAVSLASSLLFAGVPTRCVVLCARCPWPLGSCSPVCPLSVLWFVFGVLGHWAPVHRCAHMVCCVARSASLATWLVFTGVLARCLVLRVLCPWPLGFCSPVCLLCV